MTIDTRLQNTIQTYNFTAESYAQQTQDLLFVEKLDRFIDLLPEKEKVLDLGCGPGRDVSYFFLKGVKDVLGVDLSSELLKIAREKNPQVSFLEQDMTQLANLVEDSKLRNNFNGVWASASYVHVPSDLLPESFLQVKNLLKKEGIFYFSVMEGDSSEVRVSKRYGDAPGKGEKYWQYYSEENLKSLLSHLKFNVVGFSRSENKFSPEHPWIDFFVRKNE